MEEKNNYIKGIVGGVIGALLFSIPWVLVYVYGGVIMSLLALIIAFGSLKFYKLFGGKITKKTSLIIIIISVLTITFLTFVVIPYSLILKEGLKFSGFYFNYLYSSKEFVSSLFRDYVISLLFTGLGISGVITSINKEAYLNKNTNNENNNSLDELSIDEQIKEIKSIYEKYNAFDKMHAVPKSVILSDINSKNKNKMFQSLKKKGIINISFNKTYFDNEAINNEEKAKLNYKKMKKNNFLTVLLAILISAIILFVLIGSAETSNNEKTKIEYETYTYKNISIKLPDTFKLEEEEDTMVSYYDLNNEIINGVMIQKIWINDMPSEEYKNNYIELLKDEMNVLDVKEAKINNLSGYKIHLKDSSNYHYYDYLVFDNENAYIIMFSYANYTNPNEKISEFDKEANKYIDSIKIDNTYKTEEL